ncbi:MAG: nucleotidyltransferase family protein [Acholeplasmatales bacterium]|nr:nucleotidyltransferase family protein [Acholeplasmatales bacterium]
MKITGVIAEYNPLHNGHVYHFNNINSDLKILIMSSSFTMRGDLSIFDKFTKTKQALDLGYDLIIELPFVYSLERADIFSLNTVSFLNLCKINEIIIGSEENNINLYEKYYKEFNKESLNNEDGKSMKQASVSLLPFKSNDILGFFYYKAIKDNNYDIELKTIKRIGNDYLDKDLNESYSSASSIRLNLDQIDKYVPDFVSKDKNKILDENNLYNYLKYQILNLSLDELKNIFMVDEGLENKLKSIYKYNNLNDYISSLVSKRYTETRIKRMLAYILFNIKKNDINEIYSNKIDFIRVLGYSDKGKKYLNEIKKDVNIYTNIKEGINKALDIELKISKILDSIYNLDLLKHEQGAPIDK